MLGTLRRHGFESSVRRHGRVGGRCWLEREVQLCWGADDTMASGAQCGVMAEPEDGAGSRRKRSRREGRRSGGEAVKQVREAGRSGRAALERVLSVCFDDI